MISSRLLYCWLLGGFLLLAPCPGLLVTRSYAAPRSPRGDFFSQLDLNQPGLEAVRGAVRRRDQRRAERALLEYFRERRTPRWVFAWPWASVTREVVLGRARAALAHDFTFENRRARLGPRINWRADPLGDREWTGALNRHDYFDDLIAAYRLTRDEQYARELDALIADWIRENPVPTRPTVDSDAWRTLEAGHRMAGPWPRTWDALRESTSFRPETRLAMLRSFAEHAAYLDSGDQAFRRSVVGAVLTERLIAQDLRHRTPGYPPKGGWMPPERLTPTGVAALQGANGLAHVGAFFPEFGEAEAWRSGAVERLEAEMGRQVLPDGGHTALSTLYHQVALRNLAQPLRLIALAPGLEFSDAYLNGVERMLRWNLQLARPDGTLPQLNDADRVTVTDPPEFLQDLSAIAQPRVQAALGRWRSFDFATASLALPSSGLFVMRAGVSGSGGRSGDSLYLCIDAGPYGAGHQHEDGLGMELYAFGRTLLVDPGRYLSTEEGAWFRSPAAHNTVLVDGHGQNRRATSAERWVPPVPSASRWSSTPAADIFEGSYDEGYGPTSNREVKHVRQVLFVKPSYWVVWDLLTPDRGSTGSHRFDQLWHFPPGRAVVDQARRLAATADEGRANMAVLPVTSEATVRIVEGGSKDGARGRGGEGARGRRGGPMSESASSLQGWYSSEYRLREPAPVAVFTREGVPPVLFETVLFPYAAGPRPAFGAERVPVSSAGEIVPPPVASAFRFSHGRSMDLILMAHDPHRAGELKQAGDLQTDAASAVMRFDPSGRPVRLIAQSVSSVIYAGRIIFSADRRQDDIDIPVRGDS